MSYQNVDVTVIMPVYNAGEYLEEAVNSVLEQSKKRLELILVDDGSTDNSGRICEKYASNDDRVRVFHQENHGICCARNRGLEAASGEYIAFIDDDDRYLPGLLEDNYGLAHRYYADVIKFGRRRVERDSGGNERTCDETRMSGLKGLGDGGIKIFERKELADSYHDLHKTNIFMYIWTGLYRREFLLRHNIRFDESFRFGHEDYDFNLRVLEYVQTFIVNAKCYYQHNWRSGVSQSSRFDRNRADSCIKTASRERLLLRKLGMSDADIMVSYMDNVYLLMSILNLDSCAISTREKCRYLEMFRDRMKEDFHCSLNTQFEVFRKNWMAGLFAILYLSGKDKVCLDIQKRYREAQTARSWKRVRPG